MRSYTHVLSSAVDAVGRAFGLYDNSEIINDFISRLIAPQIGSTLVCNALNCAFLIFPAMQ